MNDFDVIVIGGEAPGGHCVGAPAEGGLHVALVERELVGVSARIGVHPIEDAVRSEIFAGGLHALHAELRKP